MDRLSTHLSTLSTGADEVPILENQSPLSTFILPSMSSSPMATDEHHHLLVYHHGNVILCRLPSFEILFSVSTASFTDCPISDVCYYTPLSCFLVSSANNIYSLSSNQSIGRVRRFANSISSITHSSTFVFVSYLFGSAVERWDLHSNNDTPLNTWHKADLLEPLDMGINCIRAAGQCIGMSVKEKNFSWRIDVFDVSTMNRVRRGHTIQQENGLSNWIGIVSPLDHYQWLFADGDEGLYLIDHTDAQDPKQRQLLRTACNVCLLRDSASKKYAFVLVQSHEALHLFSIR